MMQRQRGLSRRQEQDAALLIRDTRTFGQKFDSFFKNPRSTGIAIFVLCGGGFVFPGVADILLILAITAYIYSARKKSHLPFRLPKRAHIKDYNSPKPGSKEPSMSDGIYYFGNEQKTNKELWFTNEDMRTHVLIFGSTGSGKTTSLISMAYNSLVQASGFIYVDGKGDNSLFALIYGMVRAMGREDDLLLVNFMTGARDITGPQKKRLSNTLNPFAKGSSSMLSQLIVSMMDSGSSSGDGDMWKGRAIAFVEALMKVLVYQRDLGNILLDANTIRNYFSLERLEAMSESKVFIRDGQYNISLESAPESIMEPMKNYLLTLPGYNKERKGKQVSQTYEQHGYITMQLTRVFTSLADTYGHILRVRLAEVDFKDVVLNRRILLVLLPALEKSPDELANLGKVVIASLKTMLAAGLGDEVEGSYAELVTKKPTNSETPFLCILDEYGYYAVEGFAVVPAQARSLGFSVVFSGQDLPAFQKASKEEAASIGANTNIKICMKLEDPTETWDFFNKTAGEAYVTNVDSFQSNAGSVSMNYQDTKGAKVEKRGRIDLQDLKDQGMGQAHVFFRSDIIRANLYYSDPKPVKEMRLNHQLRVDLPSDEQLYKLVKGIEDFEALAGRGVPTIQAADTEAFVSMAADYRECIENSRKIPVEGALQYLLKAHEERKDTVGDDAVVGDVYEEGEAKLAEDKLDIFMAVNVPELTESLVADIDPYHQPLLREGAVIEGFRNITRAMGGSDAEANLIADEILKDMHKLTEYRRPRGDIMSVNKYVDTINKLMNSLGDQNDAS